MYTTTCLLNEMVNLVNLKLKKMERGYYVELNGCILDLVKGNEHYCLAIEPNKHEMFKIIMHIDDFIYVLLNYMKGDNDNETLYTLPDREINKHTEKSRAFQNDRGLHLYITEESL